MATQALTFSTDATNTDFVPSITQNGLEVVLSTFPSYDSSDDWRYEHNLFFYVSGVPRDTLVAVGTSDWVSVNPRASVYWDDDENKGVVMVTVKQNIGLSREFSFGLQGEGTDVYTVTVKQDASVNLKLSGMSVLNATCDCTDGTCSIDEYHYSCSRKDLVVLPELPERGTEGTTYFIGSHTMDGGYTEYVWSNASGWVNMGVAAASLVNPATAEILGLVKLSTAEVLSRGAVVGMNANSQLMVPVASLGAHGVVLLGSQYQPANSQPYVVGIGASSNSGTYGQLCFNLSPTQSDGSPGVLVYERVSTNPVQFMLKIKEGSASQMGVVKLLSSLNGYTDEEVDGVRNTHAASVGLLLDGLESYVRSFITDSRLSTYFDSWASGKDIPSAVWEAHQVDILQSLDDAILASDTLSELVASNVRIYMDERFTDEYLLSLVLDDLQKISRNYWTNDIDEAIAEEAKKEVAFQFPEQLSLFLSKQENVNAIASVVKEEVKDILNEEKDDIVAGYIREVVEGDIKITIDGEKTTFPAVVKKEVSNYSTIPAGTVIMHAGIADVAGFVDCDGRSLSRSEYPALFNAIGTTYGSTSSSTFNVPNFNGRFAQGAGVPGQVKEAGLPNITGTFATGAYYHSAHGAFTGSEEPPDGVNRPNSYNANAWRVRLDASRSSSIYGKSTTVQPPALTMRFLIKF